jgi:hypothetical protein
MPTMKPRLNVTFDHATASVLADLAKEEHISISSLAKELILEALERREDLALSSLAKLRDKRTQKYVKHKDAWK